MIRALVRFNRPPIPIMKLLHLLTYLTAGLGLGQLASAQTTIFSQDFSSLGATAPIINSTGTTSTQVSNVNGTLGSGTGEFNYRLGSQQTLSVVEKTTGDYALRLTDNNTISNDSLIARNFTGVSTTGSGANIISGSFEYTPLALSTGTRGDLVFAIATTGQTGTSGTNTAVQLIFSGGLILHYVDTNNTLVNLGAANLAVGTTYRINVTADFSNNTQDTWGFSVVNTGNETELFSISGLTTRADNITPGAIFMAGAGNGGRISSDPHIQLDNINFSAIPEPGTYALWFGAGTLLIAGLRRRHR